MVNSTVSIMKKAVNLIAVTLVLAAFVAVVLLSPIGHVIFGVVQIKRMESAMRESSVYEPVAERLALYCQSDHEPFPDHLTSAWFPTELNAIGRGRGSVNTTSAHIEMGGGFHHFGYSLSLDESASDATINVWKLQFYSEGSGEKHLTTVSLSKTKRLAPGEIMMMVADGCDRQIATMPDNPAAHQEKIQMYLRFDQIEAAREACRTMLEQLPDDWWAVLVNALLNDSLDQDTHAEQFIVDWVNKNPNYFRFLDLAYFYQLTNEPIKASTAVKDAIAFDANTEWGHGGNSEYRGYTAAMYAYESGHYAECGELCEKLIGVTINGNYAKRGLSNLLLSAKRAKDGETSIVKWDDAILPFDAFDTIDVEKLLDRKVNRPTRK